MLYPLGPFPFNGLELAVVALALCGLAIVRHAFRWSLNDTLIAAVLFAPVLLLSAAQATQFMTMDEYGISDELLDPEQRAARQLAANTFFTGGLVALPVMRVMESFGAEASTIRMTLKSLWWLLGAAIVCALTAATLLLSQRQRRVGPFLFSAAFASLFILPTTQLALKTFNYDLFSFGLAALAVILLLHMLARGNARLGWAALVAATFAAQEKLTGSPYLMLAIFALAMTSVRADEGTAKRIAAALKTMILSIGAALTVSFASLGALRLLGVAPTDSFFSLAMGPLASWSWLPLRAVMNIDDVLAHRVQLGLAAIALLLAIAAAGAWISPGLRRLTGAAAKLPIRRAPLLAFVLLFVAGVASALLVQAYWAPYHSTQLGSVALMQQLNGAALHVGADTLGGHLWGVTFYALAVLVAAVPTALWAAGLAGAALAAKTLTDAGRETVWSILALFVLALAVPIAAAVIGTPFASRYFNLNITLVACALLIAGAGAVETWRQPRWAAHAVYIALIVLVCLEMAPFRPLFAAFRPVWLNYADARGAEPGRLNASWMGWGEEILPAGRMLERACALGDARVAGHPCAEITLYTTQSGLWLPGPRTIGLAPLSGVRSDPPLNDRSFYMFNRLYLIQEFFPAPQIEPDFVVAHRGYVLGWVYRGDRLAASGYSFDSLK